MDNFHKNNTGVSSLFSRFIVGLGSGFLGMITLGLVLFLFWGVVGDTINPPTEIKDEFGVIVGEIEINTLFLIIIILSVFLSTLVTTLSYIILNIAINPIFNKKSTSLTHVFTGNIALFILFLPLYVISNGVFHANGITICAITHMIVVCMFGIFVLQTIHQNKYNLVNLYGNILGIIIFAIVFSILYTFLPSKTLMIAAYPLFMGIVSFGNRLVELVYSFSYKKYGSDFLNTDTTFGEDYGIKEQIDPELEFDKEFKV